MGLNRSAIIDRQAASRLLKVSVRTIDRYIRRGKLLARIQNGRVWLNKKDIATFSEARSVVARAQVDMRQKSPPKPMASRTPDTGFYRDLYEEAKRALGDYQQKLEQATYRIGQLESQVLHRNLAPDVSALGRERSSENFSAELLRKDLHDRERDMLLLQQAVRHEHTGKIIFAVLTYILIGLLPLVWLLLR